MIDASLMNDLSDYPTPATLLADVLRQPQFEVWRFSDEGPPSEITEWTDWGPRCPGWAILGDETLDRRRLLFYAGDSGGNTMTSINESGLDFARSDISVNAYESMRAEDAAAQRQRDYRAYRVAESLGVDLFATEREYLLARSPHNAPRVDAFSAHETLPLASLYLRRQNLYFVNPRNKWEEQQVDRGLFFLMCLRALLPASWGYSSMRWQSHSSTTEETLSQLAWSSLQRIVRVLQVRDEMHFVLNKPQGNQSADDAIGALEHIALLLLGAFDACARVAHIVLALPGDVQQVAWHRKDWRKKLAKVSPALLDLYSESRVGYKAYTIIKLLRNSVHGQHLQSTHLARSGLGDASLLTLPREEMSELLSLMNEIRGLDDWEVHQLRPQQAHVDPGVLVEGLLPLALNLINETVETIVASQEQAPRYSEPAAEAGGLFRPANLQAVRWQIGL